MFRAFILRFSILGFDHSTSSKFIKTLAFHCGSLACPCTCQWAKFEPMMKEVPKTTQIKFCFWQYYLKFIVCTLATARSSTSTTGTTGSHGTSSLQLKFAAPSLQFNCIIQLVALYSNLELVQRTIQVLLEQLEVLLVSTLPNRAGR